MQTELKVGDKVISNLPLELVIIEIINGKDHNDVKEQTIYKCVVANVSPFDYYEDQLKLT